MIGDQPGGATSHEQAIEQYLQDGRSPLSSPTYSYRRIASDDLTQSSSSLHSDETSPEDPWRRAQFEFAHDGTRLVAIAATEYLGDSFHVVSIMGCQAEIEDPEEVAMKIEAARRSAESGEVESGTSPERTG